MSDISNSDSPRKGLTPEQSQNLAIDYITMNPTRFIFPIKPGKKFPPLLKENLSTNASNSEEQIRAWCEKWPGCNWGLAHKKSNTLVVDVDTKPGKSGQATYDDLDLEFGFPPTEMTRTPSGGFHLIYDGPHIFALGNYGFGDGIDSPNYTILPGCKFNDGTEYVSEGNAPTAKAPQWMYDLLGRAKEKKANAADNVVDLDQPQNVEWATLFLQEDAEPAIEGKNGDFQTLKIAMGVRDKGVSEEMCFALMLEFYNERCEPPWEPEALRVKVANAYNYASQSAAGDKTAEADFEDNGEAEELAAMIPPSQASAPAIDLDKLKRKIKNLLKKTTKAGCSPEEAAAALAKARELMKTNNISDADLEKKKKKRPPATGTKDDFYAYLPLRKYIFAPTRELWPPESIASILGQDAPYELDAEKPISCMTWAPGEPEVVRDSLMVKGGWLSKPGSHTFNTYIPAPEIEGGKAELAKPWVDHVTKVFPDDADHLVKWMAHRVRYHGVKINHALIVGSDKQGIGKDTIFEPIVAILGEWNCTEVSASQSMDPKFNPHLEALFCRISEANDLGDADRFTFYERRKSWTVTPPNTISVGDKNVKLHPVINVVGVVVSGNDKSGFHLPSDDRRDYVAWSECVPADFEDGYFTALYKWYGNGGIAHVKAFLDTVDLSNWDPKAPPPKTAAFWTS